MTLIIAYILMSMNEVHPIWYIVVFGVWLLHCAYYDRGKS